MKKSGSTVNAKVTALKTLTGFVAATTVSLIIRWVSSSLDGEAFKEALTIFILGSIFTGVMYTVDRRRGRDTLSAAKHNEHDPCGDYSQSGGEREDPR